MLPIILTLDCSKGWQRWIDCWEKNLKGKAKVINSLSLEDFRANSNPDAKVIVVKVCDEFLIDKAIGLIQEVRGQGFLGIIIGIATLQDDQGRLKENGCDHTCNRPESSSLLFQTVESLQ